MKSRITDSQDLSKNEYAGLAQLGEHLPYKQEVTGSIPVPRTIRRYGVRGISADC